MASISGSSEIHSVILNMNQNYSNNTGSSFSQIVNKQLELKPNTLVALYTGTLTRKPIVLENDTLLEIQFNSVFPSNGQLTATLGDSNEIDQIIGVTPNAVSAVIPKGKYSKYAFAQVLCDAMNTALSSDGSVQADNNYSNIEVNIVPISGGNFMIMRVPYRMYFESKDGNIWLGLRYEPREIDITNDEYLWRCAIEDLDDNITTSNGITVANDEANLRFESASKVTDQWHYQLTNTPIKPMCYSHLSDPDALPCDIGWTSFNYNIDPIVSATDTVEFTMGLSDTYFTSRWADTKFAAGGLKPPEVRLVDIDEKPFVPNVLIGAYMTSSYSSNIVTSSNLTFYVNSQMKFVNNTTFTSSAAERNKIVDNDELTSLVTINMNEYTGTDLSGSNTARQNFNQLLCEVYAQDKPHYSQIALSDRNRLLQPLPQYFFRWYIRSPYSNNGALTELYDSKTDGLSIPHELVESAYLFQCIESIDTTNEYVSGGLCPLFCFKNCSSDFKVSDPRINSNVTFASFKDGGTFYYDLGINGYSFQPVNKANLLLNPDGNVVIPIGADDLVDNQNVTSLENILGVAKNKTTDGIFSGNTLFNPNKYPSSKDDSGLTKLASDKLRYNIELNLPIKAYNTTEESTNDIGQQRTIIYNTDAIVNDDNNPTVGLINKSIDPNNLKYLSLNNRDGLKLNTLDIKIRRANTNELADEITDASVELLFVSDEPKK